MLSQLDKEVIQSYYRLSIIVSSIIAFLIAGTLYTVLNFQIEYAIGLACLSLSIGFSQTKKGKYNHLPWFLGVAGGVSCFLAGPAGWVMGAVIIGGSTVYEYFGKHKNYGDLAKNLIDVDRYRVLILIVTLTRFGYDIKFGDFPKFCAEKYVFAKFSCKNRSEAKPLLKEELQERDHNLKISWGDEGFKVWVDSNEEDIENTELSKVLNGIRVSIKMFEQGLRKIMFVGELHRIILEEMVTLNEAIQVPEKVLEDKEKLKNLNKIFEKILNIVKPNKISS